MDHLLVLVLALMSAVVASGSDIYNVSTPAPLTTNCNVSVPTTTEKICDTTIITQHIPGRVKMKWNKAKPCQIYIYYQNFTGTSLPLCWTPFSIQLILGKEMCEERRCGNFQGFQYFPAQGYTIHDNLSLTIDPCDKVLINCEENKELVAYKAVTGVLVALILVVVLLQFARPTVQAFRKRFLPKPQERWIGPTQSQSVSYHRGQGGSNNNTAKRQSYPGLERLTVSSSREPSSNRNSDYESYGC